MSEEERVYKAAFELCENKATGASCSASVENCEFCEAVLLVIDKADAYCCQKCFDEYFAREKGDE